MIKKIIIIFLICIYITPGFSTKIIASVGDKPITDLDITNRVKLMNKQRVKSADNRLKAFENIVNDYVKLDYANNFKIKVNENEINKEFSRLNFGFLSKSEKQMAIFAIKANIAWQQVIFRTIFPTISISDEEIKQQQLEIESKHGLPITISFLIINNISEESYNLLENPKSCNEAISKLEKLNLNFQEINAKQYELSQNIRNILTNINLLSWSKIIDGKVYLICDKKKLKEFSKLENVIKQNAIYKKAMFISENQLKQLKRKSVIVINDPRYKI